MMFDLSLTIPPCLHDHDMHLSGAKGGPAVIASTYELCFGPLWGIDQGLPPDTPETSTGEHSAHSSGVQNWLSGAVRSSNT